MLTFSSNIRKIGVNPYVLLPSFVLEEIFKQSGKNKGTIPVRGTLNGKEFIQTLVKYSGKWRLYLNTPMRKSAGIDVGDLAIVLLGFDPKPRTIPFHPQLAETLSKNKKRSFLISQDSKDLDVKRNQIEDIFLPLNE